MSASGSSERAEPQQGGEFVAALEVGGDALPQHGAELLVERAVGLRLVLRQLGQVTEHLPRQHPADLAEDGVVLQGLPGDVQRQVAAVDQPVQEPQVLRQQVVAVALDQDAFRAELQPVLRPPEAQQLRVPRRAIQDRLDLQRRVQREVQPPQRRLPRHAGEVPEEPPVLVVGDAPLRLHPDRRLVVDVQRLLALLAGGEKDRVRHERAVPGEDVPHPLRVRELLRVVPQVQRDIRASAGLRRLLDRVLAGPVTGPFPAGLLGIAAGRHLDPVGEHEGRVEPHAELPDQRVRVGPLKLLGKPGGPAAGDGAEVLDEVGLRHPDAVVRDRQRLRGGVGGDGDLQIVRRRDGLLPQRKQAVFIEGVAGVGDQFADGDLAVLVQALREQPQQLGDVGLEGVRFGHRTRGEASGVKRNRTGGRRIP